MKTSDTIDPARFRAMLETAGLHQADVPRLVAALVDVPRPTAHEVSRYCRGVVRVPAALAALVELYRRCPKGLREQVLPPFYGGGSKGGA